MGHCNKSTWREGRKEPNEDYTGTFLVRLRPPPASEVKVDTDRHHLTAVTKVFILDILVPRVDILEPDLAIGPSDRDSVIEPDLQSTAHVPPEPILRIIESAGSLHGRVIPSASSENEGAETFPRQ